MRLRKKLLPPVFPCPIRSDSMQYKFVEIGAKKPDFFVE
jgi:hypothetical protein